MANYINNKEFYELIVKYLKTHDRKTYNKMGKMFLLIATNVLNKGSIYKGNNLIGYSKDRKNEMISDTTFAMCRYIDKYKPELTNPLAYFTEVAKNVFLQRINENHKIENTFTSIEYIENCFDTSFID